MSCTIKTMHKIDDRAWIREDTLTMLLTTARLTHLQQSQRLMKWYNGNWYNWMTEIDEMV